MSTGNLCSCERRLKKSRLDGDLDPQTCAVALYSALPSELEAGLCNILIMGILKVLLLIGNSSIETKMLF